MAGDKPAVLLPGGIEASRALAQRGVSVIAVAQGGSASFRASRSVRAVIEAPTSWDERFDRWFDAASFPSGSVILPGNDDAMWRSSPAR